MKKKEFIILSVCMLILFNLSFISAAITVDLNSPADDSTTYVNNNLFNASATTTATSLVNMSLWTNETGSWALRNTTNLISAINDGLGSGGSTYSTTGKIGAKLQANQNIKITQVKRTSASTATKVYIYDAGHSLLDSASYNGSGIANFNYDITGGTIFYIYHDAEGASFNFNEGTSGNGNKTNINVLTGMYPYSTEFGNPKGLESIITENYTSIGTQTWNRTITEDIIWNVQACDSDNDCSFSVSNYTLLVDSTAPTLDLLTPTIQNYLKQGDTLYLTGFANDTNLDTVWYEYNGTNTTISGVTTETLFNESITQADISKTSLIVWANDTLGNLNSETISWGYNIFGNSNTFNSSTFETASESFILNVTANSSLTAVTLDYNGTDYGMIYSGGLWSKTIQVPEGVSNRTLRYKLTYAGDTIYSDYFYQDVKYLTFTLCNATYSTSYLNISFKDEADLSAINATVPTSTFTYYLGSGVVNKSYTYTSTSVDYDYAFCATSGSKNLYVLPYFQYKQGTDYPQRIWQPSVQTYTNTSTDKILYLLSSVDGIYVTFQVVNSADQTLSNVEITAVREIDGEDIIVATGTTGGDGSATLWLNPDFTHTFTFEKSGFTTETTSFAPTQTGYTITMTGGSTSTPAYVRGIKYSTLPTNTSLVNDTVYTFGFNLTSSYYELEEYGFSLRLTNGTVISGDSTTISGTSLTKEYNTTNLSRIYMDYYWKINGTYNNGTIYWRIYNTDKTQWSIKTFFQDFNSVMDAGVFGIDNFGRYLIIFLILFFSVGIMAYRYGVNNPMFIYGLIFFIVFFLDVALGIIPDIAVLNGKVIPYILTFISGLIFAISIIMEVRK